MATKAKGHKRKTSDAQDVTQKPPSKAPSFKAVRKTEEITYDELMEKIRGIKEKHAEEKRRLGLPERARAKKEQGVTGKVTGIARKLRLSLREKKEEKEKEMKRAERIKKKEIGWYEWLAERVSGEEFLFDRRKRLQLKKRKELEKAWGEPVVGVVYHTHNSGCSETGYSGSPDGVFSLNLKMDRKRVGRRMKPRLVTLLKSIGADGVFVTDHEACLPGQMKKLKKAVDRINEKEPGLTLMMGTELTSKGGHFVILEAGKPLLMEGAEQGKETPKVQHPAQAMAEWAFQNGFDVMVPHPNPSRQNPRRIAENRLGVDISLEREIVENILRIADKYDKFVYIAYGNGTTLTNYRANLMGNRNHWWEFWKQKRVSKEVNKLYAKRAIWVAESDGHIACEYPSGMQYFRKSEVVSEGGKISSEKIHDAVAKERELEWQKFRKGQTVPLEEKRMLAYAADDDFNFYDKTRMVPYFLREYARLLRVWARQVLSGNAGQYAGAPKRNIDLEYRRMARYTKED